MGYNISKNRTLYFFVFEKNEIEVFMIMLISRIIIHQYHRRVQRLKLALDTDFRDFLLSLALVMLEEL